MPAPIRECDRHWTDAKTIAIIDALLDEGQSQYEIAAALDERGLKTGMDEPFTPTSVGRASRFAGLKSLRQRLREKGMLTSIEMSRQLGIARSTVIKRAERGQLKAVRTSHNGRWVFWPLDQQPDGLAGVSGVKPDVPADDGVTLNARGAV